MKNRKREICTSGSARDEAGQPPHLLGRRQFLHLAAGAAALPTVSRVAGAQAYPAQPVRVVVPFAPALADLLAGQVHVMFPLQRRDYDGQSCPLLIRWQRQRA